MLKIEEMIGFIHSPNREACLKILNDNRKLFETCQGSVNNHQAWLGGYIDHITEVMNIGYYLYNGLDLMRENTASYREIPKISDIFLILFLHDIEKPWKYHFENGKFHHKPEFETKLQAHKFRMKKLDEYGIVLNDEQLNALKYVEGELDDYSCRERVMNPLAALCHMADVASARIWFHYPLENERIRTC
jgi:uncharacterized SAM-dependent methyltransferase